MTDHKHIVILTPGFAKDEMDLNCIPSLQLFIIAMKENLPNTKISIVSFEYPSRKKKYTWNEIDVYPLGSKSKFINKISIWFIIVPLFRKINKKNPVDVIHSFWLLKCTLIGYILSKLFKIPLIATAQGQDTKKSNFYLKLFKHLNITINCCSEYNKNELLKSSKIKTFKVIPFGLNFHPSYFPSYDSSQERNIDIIGVGSLVPVKNYQLFIEIIRDLVVEFPNLKVMLIGSGIEFKKLDILINKYHIQNNLILTGHIEDRMEVLNKLNQSKIFLHTATHEGQCYAFMEAAAYGLYIVSSDVGYLPNSDKIHICYSKLEMVDNIKLLLKQKLHFEPIHTFTMQQTIIEYENIYNTLT